MLHKHSATFGWCPPRPRKKDKAAAGSELQPSWWILWTWLFFMEPGGISTFGEKKERHQRLFLNVLLRCFFAFLWITFGKSSVNAAAQWSSPRGVVTHPISPLTIQLLLQGSDGSKDKTYTSASFGEIQWFNQTDFRDGWCWSTLKWHHHKLLHVHDANLTLHYIPRMPKLDRDLATAEAPLNSSSCSISDIQL